MSECPLSDERLDEIATDCHKRMLEHSGTEDWTSIRMFVEIAAREAYLIGHDRGWDEAFESGCEFGASGRYGG